MTREGAENNMTRIEYLALFMNAKTDGEKTEIIKAYLKAMSPDANFYLREETKRCILSRKGSPDLIHSKLLFKKLLTLPLQEGVG